VWMAARAGGFHYKFSNGWRNTRDASEFFADLSRYASEQSGIALNFSA
jgi:CyaY protein